MGTVARGGPAGGDRWPVAGDGSAPVDQRVVVTLCERVSRRAQSCGPARVLTRPPQTVAVVEGTLCALLGSLAHPDGDDYGMWVWPGWSPSE
eukprot:13556567-Alexandrium_andersonii.AAC.1